MFKPLSWLALLALASAPVVAQEAAAVTKYGRTSMAIGGGFLSSAYELDEHGPDGNKWFYWTHQVIIWSAIAEARHEVVRGVDVGFRFIRSNGYDRSGEVKNVDQPGFGLCPPVVGCRADTARTDDMDGESYLLSVDTRYVGVTGGVALGRWVYPSDFPMTTAPGDRTAAIWAVRLGRFNGWHAEAGFGRHLPALVPRNVVQAGVARGNIDGTRLIRFGAGPEGLYVGGRFVTDYGLDIEPYFSARNSSDRQFAVVIKERIRLLR
jgi:hypothetical protein